MTWYAHSKENAPLNEWQTLDAHAEAVAKIASCFASYFGGAEWARAAGFLHDIGKARKPYLDMLTGKRSKDSETHHAKYGAAAVNAESFFFRDIFHALAVRFYPIYPLSLHAICFCQVVSAQLIK